jgi:trehalose/maltose hydrolase-like predicted phosphorylase
MWRLAYRRSMSEPLSPPPVTTTARNELPAYLSNGLVGLRVLDIPLLPGMVLVNGFSGVHPQIEVQAAAQAPYPLAGDLSIDGVWLTTSPQQSEFVDQRYDFGTGELTTRFRYHAEHATATVEVLTFCSKKQPTMVLQEVDVEVDAVCDHHDRDRIPASRPAGPAIPAAPDRERRPEHPAR